MKAQLIGAGLGAGAQDQRTRWAARSLFEQGLPSLLRQAGMSLADSVLLESQGQAAFMEAMPLISEFNRRLAENIEHSLAQSHFPIVLGGDHSVAVGTWSAVAAAGPEDLGLIWIDAHLDSHTPQTTESGAIHGMPLAALLGEGDARLTRIHGAKPKLRAENAFVLGARSFEHGEFELLVRRGVRVYLIDEIRRRGFGVCLREATDSLRQRRVQCWGVTLDLDAFDPREVPAVGSPVTHGLFLDEVLPGLLETVGEPSCRAFELVEYNPSLDAEAAVFRKIVRLLTLIGKARGLLGAPVRATHQMNISK